MVGAKIRRAREKAGLSQRHLAEITQLRQCQISDLERDKLVIDHVHWGTIRKLCTVLDITPNDFMDTST